MKKKKEFLAKKDLNLRDKPEIKRASFETDLRAK